MVRFPEAQARLFHNKVACKRCKSVVKANMAQILEKKVKCRRCGSKALRPLRKK